MQAGVSCVYEPIKKRKRRASNKTAQPQDSTASDDSSSPTANTDLQTSPDTSVLTPSDVLRPSSEVTFGSPGAIDTSFPASIDSILPLCEEFDDSFTYEPGCGDTDVFEGEFATLTEMGSCQKALDGSLLLSLDTMAGSVHSIDDSFFSASLDMSWNEQSWSATSSPMIHAMPASMHSIPDCPEGTGLLNHYSKVMLPSMGFNESFNNPYEQHIIPLSHRSSAVRSAIYAVASAHREYTGVENTEGSAAFHEQAVAGLSAIIEEGDGFEEALATIVLLLQYDLVSRTTHGPRGNTLTTSGHATESS